MFMRPKSLNILTHPLSRSQVLDHTVRALWLGTSAPINLAMLESVDVKLMASGQSEEIIIDRIKKH
jgi:aromatic ring-cleaving dioxygenase